MRETAGHDGVRQPPARRYAQPLIVQERALAALGREQLVGGGIVDQPGDDRALPLERDRNREVGDAVQKIQRAVDRIDDPAVRPVGAFPHPPFLADEAVAGTRLFELLTHDLLGAVVGGGDEIGRPLERYLQVLDLTEIALERAAGLARGLDHHVEEGGAEHGVRGAGALAWRCVLAARAVDARGEARGLPAERGHVKSVTRAVP